MSRLFAVFTLAGGMAVACQAHDPFPEAKSINAEVKDKDGLIDHSIESVIRFVPDAEPPFQLNEAVAKRFVEENNKHADERLDAIMAQLADLVAEYPDSPAAELAKRMVEESDYYLTDYGRLYPKGAMIFGGVVLVR